MIIKVTTAQMGQIDDKLRAGGKIDALKILRDTHRPPGSHPQAPSIPLPSTISLKDAKDAVERREWDLGLLHTDTNYGGTVGVRRGRPETGSVIICYQPIKRLVCDFGEGEVEIDMDGLSLRALSGLNGSIKISDAVALIDLYSRIKAWDDEQV
jgi:hypothetical protein